MKKTVYFHIGHPKCGSSSIQNFCDKNREQLLSDGFCYPNIPDHRHWHAQISPTFYKAAGVEDRSELYLGYIIKAINESPVNTIILSAECFYEDDISFFERFDEFNVKFIYYIRNQEDFIESSYNQLIKEGNLNCIYQITPFTRADYYLECINKLAEKYSEDDISVRLFDSELFIDGDLIQDFLYTLNCKNRREYTFKKEKNKSLKGEQLKYAARLAILPLSPIERKNAIDEISELPAPGSTPISLLTTSEKQRIQHSCYKLNKEIASRFLSNYEEDKLSSFVFKKPKKLLTEKVFPFIERYKQKKEPRIKLDRLALAEDKQKQIFSLLSNTLRTLIISRTGRAAYEESIDMPYVSLPNLPENNKQYLLVALKRDQATVQRELFTLSGEYQRFSSPLLIEKFDDYNLVFYRDIFYGIPAAIPVDWQDINSYAMNPLFIKAFSIDELKSCILTYKKNTLILKSG